jgi:hypothetical protein
MVKDNVPEFNTETSVSRESCLVQNEPEDATPTIPELMRLLWALRGDPVRA